MKTWHEQVREARAASRLRAGNVAIKDQEGTWIIFSVMPEAAYARLLELDWETERGGYFVWDQDQGRVEERKPLRPRTLDETMGEQPARSLCARWLSLSGAAFAGEQR